MLRNQTDANESAISLSPNAQKRVTFLRLHLVLPYLRDLKLLGLDAKADQYKVQLENTLLRLGTAITLHERGVAFTDIGQQLGVTESTVRSWIKGERLPASMIFGDEAQRKANTYQFHFANAASRYIR